MSCETLRTSSINSIRGMAEAYEKYKLNQDLKLKMNP